MDFKLKIRMKGERLLSANQRNQMHWRDRHRISKRIKRDLWALTTGSRPTEPLDHATVTIRSWRKRLLDPDNLVGGCKPYIDALVTNRILIDDKPENISLKIHQATSNQGYAVEITVEGEMQTK